MELVEGGQLTYRPTVPQTHGPADPRACRPADVQTYRPPDLQTSRPTDLQTLGAPQNHGFTMVFWVLLFAAAIHGALPVRIAPEHCCEAEHEDGGRRVPSKCRWIGRSWFAGPRATENSPVEQDHTPVTHLHTPRHKSKV